MDTANAEEARGPVQAAAPRFPRHQRLALGLQFVHVAWFGSTLDAGLDPGALAISGGASVLIFSFFLLAEYRWNGCRVTPLLFYLAAGVFRLGLGPLFVVAAVQADRWRLLQVGIYDVSGYLMQGHWLALLGDWCFVAGCVAVTSFRSRDSHGPASVAPNLWRRVWRAGLGCAVTSGALRVAGQYVTFGGLGYLVNHIQTYGTSGGVYLMLLAARRGRGGLLAPGAVLAYAVLALDVADAFFSYMKSDLLVAVLPLILIAFDREAAGGNGRRRATTRFAGPVVATCLIAYFFLFVISNYSVSRRLDFAEYGRETNPYDVPVTPHLADALAGAIPGTEAFQETHRFPNGAWRLVRRMSLTPLPAWTYQRVEQVGFQETSFFEALLVQVTPRLFWPGKPSISPGRDFSITIGQFRSVEEASSSTAVTLQGAYYWRGGYVWLILGCALTGAAFGAAWLLFRNHSVLNPASAIVTFMLCHEGFRWFESAFVGGFPMFLYVLIVFLPLQLVMRRVVGYRPVLRPGRFDPGRLPAPASAPS